MRRTLRLLAGVKPVRYLEAGTPTGLTGLWTHNSPRSTLLYLYSTTLEKLKVVPEASLYRQSVEALTKHRFALVEATVPPGYEEWEKKAEQIVKEKPEQFRLVSGRVDGSGARTVTLGNRRFIVATQHEPRDVRLEEWDGEKDEGGTLEGPRDEKEREDHKLLAERKDLNDVAKVQWTPEPQLTADQISDLENKIGAGLIEEVIQVAEGEFKLVDTMIQAKVWEDLQEKPVESQWAYFDRNSH
ncbi:NADH-ubiquinone oxidoreductase 29.9 kDa subunit [Colletotrichum sidae]|uniref:NADH-ubiquinone oxidoreductase 29.9 kDa subunit n=3 Tax=Colletotrichum orbiculare species complex TaxID=2707354 RepID=N4VHP8_COLOR|nr:NADH-ubiquinone oxidoreductase 29.9 kDa subunit [Colletotrichum orbiculare MAFF 240422]TDZ28225.1 NADH-ubiquinone oxidoreductase 29.9 kDa subunit [Colletotrichum trifolii]TEA03260.1 NADH-ubiquinone oxidoreductase 29.9 kDa subunit [Colletotrichum sidae]